MSDSDEGSISDSDQGSISDSDESEPADKRRRTENSGLGVVFAIVGVALMLTLDSWAIGLPFVIVGITFFATAYTTPGDRDTKSSD
jgi:hypothetical protein